MWQKGLPPFTSGWVGLRRVVLWRMIICNRLLKMLILPLEVLRTPNYKLHYLYHCWIYTSAFKTQSFAAEWKSKFGPTLKRFKIKNWNLKVRKSVCKHSRDCFFSRKNRPRQAMGVWRRPKPRRAPTCPSWRFKVANKQTAQNWPSLPFDCGTHPKDPKTVQIELSRRPKHT